ncbi:MAG: phage portal protein [Coriobacteriaceae bacterium]|nr:phage portal protein [Coriobacteriaceae bacterium]
MGWLRNLFSGRPDRGSRIEMVTQYGESYYAWNGKLYQSDIVRACIRPKTQAIGKIIGKHIRDSGKDIKVNPEPYIKFLLEEPNPYMTGQMLQEKLANQLALNGNAFALIIRDDNGVPQEIYPVPASTAEALYGKDGTLYIKFTFLNGNTNTFAYTDLIHLRRDYYDRDIFGTGQVEALTQIMECIGTLDQGIVKAVKSSGRIRWLLKLPSATRPEDTKKAAKRFAEDYLSTESETMGVAGVSSNAEATQITPHDVVPESELMKEQIDRVYAFFNTNEKIVKSQFTDEEWNAYYEAEVEPVIIQFSNAWTQRLFTRRERGYGNKIVFEAANLQCASLNTKLALQQMVDRGAMTPNEWRATMNLAPLPGGDKPIRRLDTQVVNEKEVIISGKSKGSGKHSAK